MTSSKKVFASWTLLAVTLWASGALAQRSATDLETARQLYNQGIALRDAGDIRGALEKFKAAHALGNTPVTGVDLCRAYGAVGQPVEAREACLSVGRIPQSAQETQRSVDARNEASRIAEEMRAKISTVRLRIFGVPQGRDPIVSFDSHAVPLAALGEARAVNPGSHVVTARVGNGTETRATFETREGESRDIDLTVIPGSDPAANVPTYPERPPEKNGGGTNGLAIAMFVTGGVAAAVGIGGFIRATDAEEELARKCPQKRCGPTEYDELDAGKSAAGLATGAFVVSGIALTVGLISVLTWHSKSTAGATKPTVAPVLGLGGAGIHGTF